MTDSSKAPRRILHTSDVHLQSPDDKGCQSLEAVVNLAIKTEVDLVIIAGDFFENNRVGDSVVYFAIEQLQRLTVPTFILPGNHDPLTPDSVYNRVELWNEAPKVMVFRTPRGETVDLPELGVSIWGKPIDSHDGDIQPLAGIPRPKDKEQWHIAVAHGYYCAPLSRAWAGHRITLEEIANSGYDYIALGHWANFMCVCDKPVCAYYCDSPAHPSPHNTANIVDLMRGKRVQVSCCPIS